MLRETPQRNYNMLIDSINKLSELDFNMRKLQQETELKMPEMRYFIEDLSKYKEKFNLIIEEKEPHEKAADIGMATLRNEAEDIRGWAKTMLYFCNEIYALIDPETTDNTEAILKSEFPSIKILKQDRSLGDSDNAIEGDKHILIMHANYNYFINELVDDGEIFFLFSADERFYPGQLPIIEQEIKWMREHPAWNSWYIPQKNMYQFYPDEFHVIDFSKYFSKLQQFKFFRKVAEYKHGLPHHSGWNWRAFTPAIKSKASWFHYCFVKTSRPAFQFWRDQKEFKKYPKENFNNPISNWRNLPELNNKGDLIV